MKYINKHLEEVEEIVKGIKGIDRESIENIIKIIIKVRENKGRLFFLGVGGSAGSASHAVNDFRKIAGIEAYTPTDNVSELTARTNDDGWSSVFSNWLKTSNLNKNDAVFILSVGGGNAEKNISANLVEAMKYALEVDAKILGIVGRDGGYTAKVANACVVVPTVNPQAITPHTESFHGIIWHLIVSHPTIAVNEAKWESTK